MEVMDQLSPETIQAFQEAGIAISVIILSLVAIVVMYLVSRQNKATMEPFKALVEYIQAGQVHLEETQDRLARVVEENTRSQIALRSEFVSSTHTAAEGTDMIYSKIGGLEHLLISDQGKVKAGVLVVDRSGAVIQANDWALKILGREPEELPGGVLYEAKPVLGVTGSPIQSSQWPSAQAIKSGQVVRGVPLQLFNPSRGKYVWVIMWAYPGPCEDTSQSPDYATIFVYSLGRMSRTMRKE